MKTIIGAAIGILFSIQTYAQTYVAQAKPVGSKTWGYINTKGEFVIKPQYEKCNAFGQDGLAAIYEKKRKSFYFIKPDGSELSTDVAKFNLANIFGFGTKGFSNGMVAIQDGKTWGYLNTDGKLVIPAKYNKALEFNDGYGVVKSEDDFFIVDKKGSTNKVEIEGLQDVRTFSEGLAPYRANDQWGFINEAGVVIVKAKGKGVGYMNNGLAWAKDDAGNVGFVNAKGEMKIAAKYEAAKDFKDGLARVKSGSWSFIDVLGNSITPPAADSYGAFSNGMAYAKKEDKVGFIGKDGKWIIEPTYDRVRDFNNGYAAARQGDKWGFIDKTGKWIIEPQFADVKDFETTGK